MPSTYAPLPPIPHPLLPPTNPSSPLTQTVIWLGVFLSAIALAFRIYIRISCMRRLHSSDHMMALALALQLAFAGVGQAFLGDIYLMTRVQNGVVAPGADFLDRMTMGLRADGVMLLLSSVGIWVIKMNFLLFFYRLGRHITSYLVFWWVSVVVVVGCGAAAIGMMPFGCMFGDIMHIITKCSSDESVGGIYTRYKVSVVVDCVSDALSESPLSLLLLLVTPETDHHQSSASPSRSSSRRASASAKRSSSPASSASSASLSASPSFAAASLAVSTRSCPRSTTRSLTPSGPCSGTMSSSWFVRIPSPSLHHPFQHQC